MDRERTENFSDAAFLERLKNRDRDAVASLVSKYTVHLCRAALGQNISEDQVEEVVQSTWASFFDSVERFEGRSHVRTYLIGILYNKIREKRREHAKIQDSDDIERIIDSQFSKEGWWMRETQSPDRAIQAMETEALIRRCLASLPHNQRTAFHLREVEGEDTETICKIMDVSSTNLGVLIYRARNKLRECLVAMSGG